MGYSRFFPLTGIFQYCSVLLIMARYLKYFLVLPKNSEYENTSRQLKTLPKESGNFLVKKNALQSSAVRSGCLFPEIVMQTVILKVTDNNFPKKTTRAS